MEKIPIVHILSSGVRATLYVGVTWRLKERLFAHQQDLVDGFSKRYGVHRLVWYEVHPSMESAIGREKALKDWNRVWKIRLVERTNPEWKDLSEKI